MFNEAFLLITVVVFLALLFDLINGFHDAANSIASAISTRALTPGSAIALASSMNLAGALAFTGVAQTIGGKIVDPFNLPDGMLIVIVALVTGISWNLGTWYLGMPSSSSHALLGSLTGAAVVAAGPSVINYYVLAIIVVVLVVSPLAAFLAGYLIMSLIRILAARGSPVTLNRSFRTMQVFAAAWQAFCHGTNDAQKIMGIITLALVAGGFQASLEVQPWVKVSCASAMALGTSLGGWKIIKTVGSRLIRLEPSSGLATDFSSALVIILATGLKMPVSTSHVVGSAIIGAGSAGGPGAVRWHTVRKMAVTWLVTLPATALSAAIIFTVISYLKLFW